MNKFSSHFTIICCSLAFLGIAVSAYADEDFVVPLDKTFSVEIQVVRGQGSWCQVKPTGKAAVRSDLALIFASTDLSTVVLPPGPLEVSLLLPVAAVGSTEQKEGDLLSDLALPLRISTIPDKEWQKGANFQHPAEFVDSNGTGDLGEVLLEPSATKPGDELKVTWQTTDAKLRTQIANGILLNLDARDQGRGMRVVKGIRFETTATKPRLVVRAAGKK